MIVTLTLNVAERSWARVTGNVNESFRAAVASVAVCSVPMAVAPSYGWKRTDTNRPVLFSKWRRLTVTELSVAFAAIVAENP